MDDQSLAWIAPPAPLRRDRPHRARGAVLEGVAATVLAAMFLLALYGELPYHDVVRFASQVNSGRFVFDIAHVYLEPVTLLWHRWLGFGGSAEVSQKLINTTATALAAGIFHFLLVRLRIGPWPRIAATTLLVASCSVMTLAPSGHMKLVAFPFVTAALLVLTTWEQDKAGSRSDAGTMIAAGVLLAVGASLLVSVLATAPFAALAVLLVSRRRVGGTVAALLPAALLAAVCGVVFAVLTCVGFVLFTDQPLSLHGLVASVQDKSDLKPAGYGLAATVSRLVFGTTNNLVAAPALGSVGRAAIQGDIPSLRPYALTLAVQAAPFLATLALLAAIYIRAAVMAARGAACLVPLAFLCGAQAWTIYYGLNDPEHWFQLTAPTLLLALLLLPSRVTSILLPVWCVVTLTVNLAIIGVPTARYPLQRYQSELRAQFTPNDLLLSFAVYPGGPYLGFFELPGVSRIRIDQAFAEAGSADGLFARLTPAIDRTLDAGGRVFVFSALDPEDWNAPWGELPRRGLSKARLTEFFISHYDVSDMGRVAELRTWQVTGRKQ